MRTTSGLQLAVWVLSGRSSAPLLRASPLLLMQAFRSLHVIALCNPSVRDNVDSFYW